MTATSFLRQTVPPARHAAPCQQGAARLRLVGGTGLGIAMAVAGVAGAQSAHAATEHSVREGDTVSHLAARYGSSVQAIVEANQLNAKALIRIGQTLTVPSGTAATSSTAAPTAALTYTVKAGDTVSAIARTHDTTIQAVVEANQLDSNALIRIGQSLTIPGTTAVTTSGQQLVGSTFAGRTYPEATVTAANANKATLLAMQVPSKAEIRELVTTTAQTMGVDPALALAVATQESGFDQRAVSPANAIGTMQVIPTSGQWASELVGRQLNLLDARDNVTAGVAILRQLVASGPDLPSAIAGYYQGQSSVRKYGMFADTRRYVANVQTLMASYS